MSLATVFQVLDSARTHLDDELGISWPDQRLLPKFQESHRELKQALVLNGIPVIHQVTAVLSVPANTTDLTTVTGYPTDMITPIWMKERQTGQDNSDFVDMTQVDFLPNIDQDIWLFWWCWIGQKITLVGSLNAEQIQLRYNKDLSVPTLVSDDIGIILGEGFLSYRTAALAAQASKDWNLMKLLNNQAELAKSQIIRLNVKQIQAMPARRRPYHRRYANQTIIQGM
jgi:hypothetical protein